MSYPKITSMSYEQYALSTTPLLLLNSLPLPPILLIKQTLCSLTYVRTGRSPARIILHLEIKSSDPNIENVSLESRFRLVIIHYKPFAVLIKGSCARKNGHLASIKKVFLAYALRR